MENHLLSKFKKALTAAAVGAVMVLGGALPAAAAPSTANIDLNHKGSITFHKAQMPTGGPKGSGDGTEWSDFSKETPLAGAKFSLQPVTQLEGVAVDLSSATTWDKLAPYLESAKTFDPGSSSNVLGAKQESAATGSDGSVKVDNLPVGLYWVTESVTPASATGPIQPFLVSIPLPAKNGTWLYDLHVYPKNKTGEFITKKAVDGSYHSAGDKIAYDLTGSIPSDEGPITLYSMRDDLPKFMSYDSTESVKVLNAGGTVVNTLVAGTDYTLVQGTYGAGLQNVTLSLTAAGLAKVQVLGGSVVWRVVTAVESGFDGDTLSNTGTLYVNSDQQPYGPPTIEVVEFGSLELVKVEKDSKLTLKGAEFQIFESKADADAKTNPISVGGKTTFTTDDNGIVVLEDLKVDANAHSSVYWIVETKAPAGYKGLTDPLQVTVPKGDSAHPLQVEVPNEQNGLSENLLPKLGGTGSILTATIGGAAILAGLLLAARRRRRPVENA